MVDFGRNQNDSYNCTCSISVIFNFCLMSLNGLSVCVTVLVLALHLTDPTTQVPSYLQKLHSGFRMKLRNKNARRIQVSEVEKESNLDEKKACSASNTKYPGCEENINQNQNLEQMGKGTVTWKELAGIVNQIFFIIFISANLLVVIICSILWSQAE